MGTDPTGDALSPELSVAALSRNLGILSDTEQATLQTASVLVAGCGSVGGSVVEPLARLGIGQLRLADPDRFEESDLNRQSCSTRDLGRNKAAVHAEHIRTITSSVDLVVYEEGLTFDNLDQALEGVHLVVDGVDPGTTSSIKCELHARAARRSVPVLSGVMFGGKAALYVFDYRRTGVPFDGWSKPGAPPTSRFRSAVRWLGYRHCPGEFLSVMAERLPSGEPWPQVSYCTLAMGAIGTRAVVDLLMSRPVRSVVTVDVHAATLPRLASLRRRIELPLQLVRMMAETDRSKPAVGPSRRVPDGAMSWLRRRLERPPARRTEQAGGSVSARTRPENAAPWAEPRRTASPRGRRPSPG